MPESARTSRRAGKRSPKPSQGGARRSRLVRYGFLWVTLAFFLLSIAGHWALAWQAYQNEAREHGQTPESAEFAVEAGRDTLENWQSEFLQLIWQVAGLAYLLYIGSPQSKEGNQRLEKKVDHLLDRISGGDKVREQLDEKYPRE
jgi:hypothetical protein